jgi:uncharacterized protein with von Willebrand factor type A (vWA) domain
VNQELALRGLFTYLVHSGFPLGIRDYRDALRALQKGYGQQSRAQLLWLCQTLWARSEEETRFLNQLFRQFPFPTAEEVARRTGSDLLTTESSQEQSVNQTDSGQEQDDALDGADGNAALVPGMQFAPPTQTGLGLPRAQVQPLWGETFIFTPRPIIPLRMLIIAWRRFRIALRTGQKVDLDIDATIAERCHRGFLTTPVLIPARRNQAQLVVLIDVSDSMVPWALSYRLFVTSLSESQLGEATVYYFHNAPDEVLYERETLTAPLPMDHVLQKHLRSTLLIISDAGAARSRHSHTRIRDTRLFLARVRQYWQPIAWLNPLPKRRWQGSSAEDVSQLPHVTMFELSEDGLIGAVDVLRGQGSR